MTTCIDLWIIRQFVETRMNNPEQTVANMSIQLRVSVLLLLLLLAGCNRVSTEPPVGKVVDEANNAVSFSADKTMAHPRATYEDSVRRLQKDYLEPGAIPPLKARMPRDDDEELGVSFFKTFVGEHDDLSNLTLPRTFFGRSEINDALFCNTDFTESRLCWNDFIDVDFTDAVLSRSDLRASKFTRVRFVRTDLRGADLRRSAFEDCSFEGAILDGAVLTNAQARQLALTDAQRRVIAFTNDDGPEPDGG